MARVLIVDDHEVVRMGLATLLGRQPGLEVIGEAGTAAEAVELAGRLHPDVVVMDMRLPDGSGIEACRDIVSQRPETRVVMLTSYADEQAVMAALMAGASGYLLKQVGGRDLAQAVVSVADGASLLDPLMAKQVISRIKELAAAQSEGALTDHERAILDLVGEGRTNREIAQALFLSEKTVRNYMTSLLHKLKLSNRAQAAAYSTRRKMLGVD